MSAILTPLERKQIRQTLANAKEADCVVLVGSVARGTRIADAGDLDILVLNGADSQVLMPGVQITSLSVESLIDRVLSGDDFTQWALRFGVTIHGRSVWNELKAQLLTQAPWPIAEIKKGHAVKRLTRARELLEMNDLQAAREELGYAGNHIARAMLLQSHVFPLSRPELPDQLREVQQGGFADLLERLQSDDDVDASQVLLELTELIEWVPRLSP
jgi:hypothetical protein